MILIIGGRSQGKTAWALNLKREQDVLFDNVNDWARARFDAGDSQEEAYSRLVKLLDEEQNKADSAVQVILVTTEIGNGIVPMDPAERGFREWMGRLQIRIASDSQTVYRVCCGLPQKIKG